jgi:hypothetical protein
MTPESQLNAVTGDPIIARRMKNVEQGAATTVWGCEGRRVLGRLPRE